MKLIISGNQESVKPPVALQEESLHHDTKSKSNKKVQKNPSFWEYFTKVVTKIGSALSIVPDKLILSEVQKGIDALLGNEDFLSVIDIYVPDQEKLKKKLCPYINQEINEQNIDEIKQTIVYHYLENGRPLIVIEVPPQDVSSGTIEFWVLEAKLGTVTYTGNKWSSKELIENRIPLKSGDVFDEQKVLNNLAWLNQNPFHQTEIILSPGKKSETTNVEFQTRDRIPVRPYVGTDNTGTENAGPNRWYVGLNFSIPSIVDNVVTFQYTAAYNVHTFQSIYSNVIFFFPCRQSLSIYGGYAEIHPTIPNFHQEGRSWQVSARHDIPIMPIYKPFNQKIKWGVDFKNTNNNLFFTSADVIPVSSSAVMLFQGVLDYEFEWAPKNHEVYFQWENFGSPGKWLVNQTVADYNNLRPGANPLYFYSYVTLADRVQLPWEMSLNMEFRGQITTTSLLPSEQFGLGGLYTVRGYEERQFNADNGVLGNLEFYFPTIKDKKRKNSPRELKFLAFVDAGWGINYNTSQGEPKSEYLIGIGPGVKFYWKPYFTARLEYGFKMHEIPFGTSNMGRLHFSVMASY